VLAYGLVLDSRTLVKTLESLEPEFKSDKPGKRILESPADKLDLPFVKRKKFYFLEWK
jgi:hypothetical protein